MRVTCHGYRYRYSQKYLWVTHVIHLFGPGLCHIHPWTIPMCAPGTLLSQPRAMSHTSLDHSHAYPWYIVLVQG
jgi:hypothetical protein